MFVSSCLAPPTPFGILPLLTSLASAVKSGQSPGLEKQNAPGFLGALGGGGGAGRGGSLLGASQVEQSAREVLSRGHCLVLRNGHHFPSAQPLTWEKPQHSEVES